MIYVIKNLQFYLDADKKVHQSVGFFNMRFFNKNQRVQTMYLFLYKLRNLDRSQFKKILDPIAILYFH